MDIAMWLVNLFSLFSCFGAIVVLLFTARKSGEAKFWKLLAIVSIYVFSYASGVIFLISNYGFTIPETLIIEIIPSGPDVSYYVGSLLYLIQAWLIISVTSDFFDFPVKLSYVVFSVLAVAAFIIPDALLLFNHDFLLSKADFFIIIRLLFGYSLMEHAVTAAFVRRKIWLGKSTSWLLIVIMIFGLLVIPAMFIEDIFTLYRGMIAYNLFEASGFFLLMTTIMIAGIFHLASSKGMKDQRLSLLDISRQYGLTEREMDVLKELVASSSASYKDIAARLSISPETVKTHVSRIYRKLGVSAKQELKYKISDIKG